MTYKTHDEVKQKAFEKAELKAAYDALGPKFRLYHVFLRLRRFVANLTV